LLQVGAGRGAIAPSSPDDRHSSFRLMSPLIVVCANLSLRCNYNVGMDEIEFEWNPLKAEANERKHGISFEEAESAFYDDYARLIPDPDHSIGEERFLLLGVSEMSRLLVVIHLYKQNNRLIRIISARPATKPERQQYEEFLP
jgi:uncharacterized protein